MTILQPTAKRNRLFVAMLSASVFFSASAYANITEAPLSASSTSNHSDLAADDDYSGGYLKVGYGYKSELSPYHDEDKGGSLFLSGRYQWDFGLFVEVSHGANELDQGSNVGFNFYNTNNWHFDALTVTAHGTNEYHYQTPDSFEREKRDSTTMLGLRASGSLNDTQLQFIVAPYSFNDEYDDGVYASAWASKSWQIKNWEVYASAGVEYRSEEILNYYYSTSDVQKNIGLFDYTASGGTDVIAQIGASYPITEDILFETYYRHTNVSDSILDSPIMSIIHNLPERTEDIKEFGILFSYVF